MQDKPFSPESLAQRWQCSPEKVRTMFHNGDLKGFRLGKLIRIPASEVERYECQIPTLSHDTEGNGPSPSATANDAFVSRLVRQTGGWPKLELESFGHDETPPPVSASLTYGLGT